MKVTDKNDANESQSVLATNLIELEVDSPLTVGPLEGLGDTQNMSGIISLDGDLASPPPSTDNAVVILFV